MVAAVLAVALAGSGGPTAAQPRSFEAERENENCLVCHDTLLEARTLNPGIKEAHRRHLTSTMTEFGGRQRVCTTCHEAFSPSSHPPTANQPTAYWRLRVRKRDVPGMPASLPLLAPEDPQTFKPTLERLVCIECHSRKLKTFYPAEAK
jgi:nitrate reductase cytochrome c-type subunit